MMPRGAEVRRALERYPDVTCAERDALLRWYARARAVELVAVLNDRQLGPPLALLRRDRPVAARTAVTAAVVAATLPIALLVALS